VKIAMREEIEELAGRLYGFGFDRNKR